MNKLNSIIYRLRNVLFLLFMVGLIRLIPNIKELEFIGTIFIIFVFIYLLLDLYFYGCKSKELNNNKIAKSNINRFIDDFLNYLTKTIDLFSNLKFKMKVKCIFEQFILILIFYIIISSFFIYFSQIVNILIL